MSPRSTPEDEPLPKTRSRTHDRHRPRDHDPDLHGDRRRGGGAARIRRSSPRRRSAHQRASSSTSGCPPSSSTRCTGRRCAPTCGASCSSPGWSSAVMLLLGWLAARALKLPGRDRRRLHHRDGAGQHRLHRLSRSPRRFSAQGQLARGHLLRRVRHGVRARARGACSSRSTTATNDEARVNPLRELLHLPRGHRACCCACVLRSVAIPNLVSNGLGLLASMVAPLIMLSVGLSLRASTHGAIGGLRSRCSRLLRLLVAPVIAIGLGWLLLRAGDAAARVLVLEAGMPAMMLTLVVGERFGLDTDFIASAIFVTTAASAVTLPLVQLAGVPLATPGTLADARARGDAMRLLEGLAELLFPTRCAGCELPGAVLCDRCRDALPRVDPDGACPRCGAPFGHLVCTECWYARVGVRGRAGAWASSRRRSRERSCCTRTRASGASRPCSACLLAEQVDAAWPGWAEAVAFVPATRAALRRRGFDHGRAIAVSGRSRARCPAGRCACSAPQRATSARWGGPSARPTRPAPSRRRAGVPQRACCCATTSSRPEPRSMRPPRCCSAAGADAVRVAAVARAW